MSHEEAVRLLMVNEALVDLAHQLRLIRGEEVAFQESTP